MTGKTSTPPELHPELALRDTLAYPPPIAPCDHYVGNVRFARKALELQMRFGTSLDVTFDFDDGAPRGNEAAQRLELLNLLQEPAYAKARVGFRIHEAASPLWRDDLNDIVTHVGSRVSHLTFSKVESVTELDRMLAYLGRLLHRAGVKQQIPIHLLIETPTGFQNIDLLARMPGVVALNFGIMDYISSFSGAISASTIRSPNQWNHALICSAKETLVNCALRHGLVPVHNVCTEIADPRAAGADALRAKTEYGFLRMWSIHPTQIEPILEAFLPNAQEVSQAERVLIAGLAASWGPVRVDDTLHDRGSYRLFWAILKRAKKAGIPLSDGAQAAFF